MNRIDISDTLIERPVSFTYKRRRFAIYPLSLGKIQLCSRLIEALGFDKIKRDGELYALALKSSLTQRNECLRLLSYVTLRGDECLDETRVEAGMRRLRGLRPRDLASLLVLFLTMDKTDAVMREFGIDRESRRLAEAVKAKSPDKGSVSFGGKSLWGTLVDAACERYGWTYQYVLWGVSFSNLQLLLADHVKTVYLDEEERRRCHLPKDGLVVNASDTEALERFIKTHSWS